MGRPKADLPFGNRTVLRYVLDAVTTVASPVVLVGSSQQSRPAVSADVRYVIDEQPEQGPLCGLVTGMQALQDEADAVIATGCDSPLIRPAFLEFLIGRLSDASDIIAIDDGIRLHPLPAIYRLSVLNPAQTLLKSEHRSLQSLLAACRTERIPLADIRLHDPELDSLRSMNTPEEYKELQQWAREGGFNNSSS